MNFLRNLLASILGSLIAFGIAFFMFFILISLMAASGGGSDSNITVHEKSVLELNFSEPIKDYGGKYKFTDFDYEFEKYDGLNTILYAIKCAKTDTNIEGISITSGYLSAGISQVRALRNALEDFKNSGKFVYAYGDYYTQKDYYLASVADSIFLNPSGIMEFKGLATEVLYFKDFEDKSGIKMEVIRHGKYKSAVEPFLANEMSDANREQLTSLLSSLWNSVLTDISGSRNISIEKLNTIADSLGARSPEKAISNKLVDKIAYLDEYETALKKQLKTKAEDDVDYIGIDKYTEYIAKKAAHTKTDKIAVVYAQGEILYGQGNNETIGQGTMVDAIRKARDDKEVKAIVLRVDSPGGASLVADIIWRELELAKKVKPVVVSMGNLAASGGYYISAGADRIFAEPTTITGSIGVFGNIPNIHGLVTKLGINAEQVGTNKQSMGYSVFEPMTDDFKGYIEESIEDVYTTFLQRVADGRHMEVAQVDSIAQGRVWSGAQAQKIGLVDELGGLDKAISYAAQKVKVKDYSIKNYPEYETSLDEVFERLSGIPFASRTEQAITSQIGYDAYAMLKKIKILSEQKGPQTRLPFELNIH